MRKLIFLFSLLTISFSSYGQAINIGVLGGANISPLPMSKTLGYYQSHLITGYDAGLFADFWFNQLSIEPVIQYTTVYDNVVTDDPAYGGGISTFKYRIHYLQVPVNMFYNFPVSIGKIFVGGGPYWGFGLSSSIINISPTYTAPFKYIFNNPDYGINLDAGIRLKNRLRFSIGYTHGYTTDANNLYYFGVVKVNSVNCLIGFSFL